MPRLTFVSYPATRPDWGMGLTVSSDPSRSRYGRLVNLPDPHLLRAGNRSGREEFVQVLLACLIVGGSAPRWNTAAAPSQRGATLLRWIAQEAGLEVTADEALIFYNEFELPRRHEAEAAGWPDLCVVTATSLLMIELKTEPRSHRRGQLAHYADLAAHHHRDKNRKLVYITPELSASAVLDDVPIQHVLWREVEAELARIWSDAPDGEQAVVAYIQDVLRESAQPWVPTVASTKPDNSQLMAVAAEVHADGIQRAANVKWANPEDIEIARLSLRDELQRQGSSVRPWVWNARTSGGQALTATGVEQGYELRFSRYRG